MLGGYRYSPSPTHPGPIPRVHPPSLARWYLSGYIAVSDLRNMVVGLKSVAQLTLGD